jgi:E3 ubiquitin-protein ligase TRIP12
LNNFSPFSNDEIEEIFCGSHDDGCWKKEDLLENIIPAHGFTQESPTYLNFIEVLSEFNKDEQKCFLKFITGSTRLPYGGFGYNKILIFKKK